MFVMLILFTMLVKRFYSRDIPPGGTPSAGSGSICGQIAVIPQRNSRDIPTVILVF